MSEEDVQTPGLEGAGEAVEPKEPETPEPSDPLDAIKDPVARAEAKKARAIVRRNARDEKPEPPAPSQPVASREDLAVIVTNQAKELVSPEIREHWEELSKIPLEGYNPMDARSIADNMADRLVILKTKQAKPNPAKDLATSPGIRGSTGEAPKGDFASKFNTNKDADSWGT